MQFSQAPSRNKKTILSLLIIVFCSSCTLIYVLQLIPVAPKTHYSVASAAGASSPTSLEHIVFGIASNTQSWPHRKKFVKTWWHPQRMRGCVFLETEPPPPDTNDSLLPPLCVSGDTSGFRYTYRNGLRSAIRVARVVSETVALGHSDVRWFIFGDDDTVFFPENLGKTLGKYDHGLWYYIGSNSESLAQNKLFSYEMGFGGAGFAISYPAAKVVGKVLDSCMSRYPHLYGSDGRIHACLAELGVSLTHEPGFHQMDIRGSMFGFLASHPLSPLVSLHHLDATEPIFPNMSTLDSLEHLFQAVRMDSQRILQQTVCYDQWFSWTVSVSWGYAVQVFPNHVFLPDALRTQETFVPWRKGGGVNSFYGLDTARLHPDPCRRPAVLFLHEVLRDGNDIRSYYRRTIPDNCPFDKASPRKLEEVRVFSNKVELDSKQIEAPRRHCCDVLPTLGAVMELKIRQCGDEELIYMHP